MKTLRTVMLGALLCALVPAVAGATLPETLDHVDRKAPCFRWPAVDFDGDGVFDRLDYCNNTPRGCVVDARGCQTDADGDGVCDGVDDCANTPAGEEVNEVGCSKSQLAARGAPAAPAPAQRATETPAPAPPPAPRPVQSEAERQLVEGGRLRLENVYFETGKTTLLPESEATLREVGEALEKFPDLKVEVEGHTDSRGTAGFNQRLSQGRAGAVRQWLLDHHRLSADNIVAVGYGETRLEVSPERNDDDLQRNRRVELRVLNPEALPKGVRVEGPR